MKLSLITTSFLAFALNSSVTQAQMMELDFENITNKLSGIDISNQLGAEIYDSGSASTQFGQTIAADEVLFTFTNNVSATLVDDGYLGYASKLTEVYFEINADNYTQTSSIQNSSIINNLGGVTNFTSGANKPPRLPSEGNADPAFTTTVNFGADAKSSSNNSLNSSDDILGIIIQLQNGYNFSNLQGDLASGVLRLGLHVVAINDSKISDSFVNNPFMASASPVPLPAAAWLFGPALLVAARKRRKA